MHTFLMELTRDWTIRNTSNNVRKFSRYFILYHRKSLPFFTRLKVFPGFHPKEDILIQVIDYPDFTGKGFVVTPAPFGK